MLNKLTKQLETLKEDEKILSDDVKKLKDPEYAARYAREKYLYSKTDEKIFKLLCVLAGLSGMTYARIKDAYTVIDDAQKNIDSNCDVTSEQGKRIKQIALMHLQRIQEDKERYEKLEAFIKRYTNEIDVLAARYGNLDQFIEAKMYAIGELFSIEKERIERNITDLQTTIKQEIDDYEKKIVQNLDEKLDNVKCQLDSTLQDSNETLKKCELEKREIESICAEAKKSLQLKQDDVLKLLLAGKEELNQAVNNYIVMAGDDLSKIEDSLRDELESLHEGNVKLLNESRQLTEKAVDKSEGLIHNMTLLYEKMVEYEKKLSRKYRKRFTVLSVVVCGISILTTVIICLILK